MKQYSLFVHFRFTRTRFCFGPGGVGFTIIIVDFFWAGLGYDDKSPGDGGGVRVSRSGQTVSSVGVNTR